MWMRFFVFCMIWLVWAILFPKTTQQNLGNLLAQKVHRISTTWASILKLGSTPPCSDESYWCLWKEDVISNIFRGIFFPLLSLEHNCNIMDIDTEVTEGFYQCSTTFLKQIYTLWYLVDIWSNVSVKIIGEPYGYFLWAFLVFFFSCNFVCGELNHWTLYWCS